MSGLAELPIVAAAIPRAWSSHLDEAAVSVHWSSSGPWLAAAAASGTVVIFNTVDGERLHELGAHRFGVTQVVWHPREPILATAGQDGWVRLWDPLTGTQRGELACGTSWVEHIAWSDTGRLLATAAGRKLRIWSTDGQLIRDYPDHSNTIAGIAWRRCGEELASACYGGLQFWSPDSAKPVRTSQWQGSMISLAWSPDGRYLCHGNQDATICLWVVSENQPLQMQGYPTKVRELSWDHRSRYLATSAGSSVAVWDCYGKGPAGSTPMLLRFHSTPVTRIAFQHHGRLLVSGCGSGQLALWKPGKRRDPPEALGMLPATISSLAWSADDELFAAGALDGSVAVYRLAVVEER